MQNVVSILRTVSDSWVIMKSTWYVLYPICKNSHLCLWELCALWWGAGMVIYLRLSVARCRFAYVPADATATLSLAPLNPDWYVYLPGFTFLVPAYPDSPGQNSLSLASVKSTLVLPFLYRLTQIIPDKVQRAIKQMLCCCFRVVSGTNHIQHFMSYHQ